ncbi:MAG: endo-1,4-beta-xylanase, partial [Armatimonadetes bacterium]|nr:endo-1,4-beta-xylanase [Armatimonadota bacterium]
MKAPIFRFATLLGVLSLVIWPARAQTPDNLLVNPAFAEGTTGWRVPNSEKGRSSVVDAQIGPYTKALRVEVKPAPDDKQWAVVLRQIVNAPLKKGEPLTFRVWVRSPNIAKTYAFVEPMGEPYVKSLEKVFDLTPAWQEITVSGAAREDYAAGGTSTGLQLAFGTGTVEITGVRLVRGTAAQTAAPMAPVANVAPLPAAPTVAGASLIQNGDFAAPLQGNWFGGGKLPPQMEIVPAQVGSFSKALRLSVAAPADSRPWDSRLAQKVDVPVKKGDVIYIRAWVRSPQSGPIGMFYQMVADPFTKSAERIFKLTPQWTEYKFSGVATQDFAPGESLFEFHVGQTNGTVEIAGVRVENLGPTLPADLEITPVDYWGGRKHDDTWKKAAFERIEKIRKGDVKIRVVDAQGKPVGGATVKLAQTRQQFRWGTAINENRVIDTQNPDSVRYRAEIERLYNTVVFEGSMKWGLWKTTNAAEEEAKRARVLPQVEEAIRQLRAKGFEVRGHALVWGRPDHLPHKVLNLENEALRLAVKDQITQYLTRFEGQVYEWDVVTENIT